MTAENEMPILDALEDAARDAERIREALACVIPPAAMPENQPSSAENDAGEYAALWAVLRTADDPAEALGELLFDVWNEGWEAARSESGLFCARAGGCLPPGMNERERYNQNPHPSTRPIPPAEGQES